VITFVFLGCYGLLLADLIETGSGGAAAKRRGREVPRQRGPSGTVQDTWFLKKSTYKLCTSCKHLGVHIELAKMAKTCGFAIYHAIF
jgi:hypothetical protein